MCKKLVITFNHKDGAETITLEDIETALTEGGFGADLFSFVILQITEDPRRKSLNVFLRGSFWA